MARLNAKWDNFTLRGQTWDHFGQDAAGVPSNTVAAVCLNADGSLTYKLAADSSDRKLYLNAGSLYARLSAVGGDKAVITGSGGLLAT